MIKLFYNVESVLWYMPAIQVLQGCGGRITSSKSVWVTFVFKNSLRPIMRWFPTKTRAECIVVEYFTSCPVLL